MSPDPRQVLSRGSTLHEAADSLPSMHRGITTGLPLQVHAPLP
jgi:hypothetical protein